MTETTVISTSTIMLDYSSTITIAGDLTRYYIGTWTPGYDSFSLWMTLGAWVLVWGIFEIIVAMVQARSR
jgi:uncharacterized membrane protein HdeD (DUF308 family)